ncbi:DUF2809 domain-containing protein [candidate division KSB1 bacterium]|nr:DUF2809 domain-containing protein [candidate division KSB1 bacterium]
MIGFKTKGEPLAIYRRVCFVTSSVALALAFLSKYYSGPHFRFADAYLGDLFIVICLYFILAGSYINLGIMQKFIVIMAIACFVELFQWTKLPAQLNLPEPFVFILGTSFDPLDFVFYGMGLTIAVLLDKAFVRQWSG